MHRMQHIAFDEPSSERAMKMKLNRYGYIARLLIALVLTGVAVNLRAQTADTQAVDAAEQTADSIAATGSDTAQQASQAADSGATDPAAPSPVLSSRITLSDELAELELGLTNGGALDLELRRGRVRIGDRDVGITYPPDGQLDRSWRALLESTRDQPPEVLAAALVGWAAEPRTNPAGTALAGAIRNALGDQVPPAGRTPEAQDTVVRADTAAVPATLSDSVEELNRRIERLQENYYELLDERDDDFAGMAGADLRREIREEIEAEVRREVSGFPFGRFSWWNSPFNDVWDGISGALSTLFLYGIMVAIGAGLVYLARDHLTTVSRTVRRYTLRSWLVGLAGSFLILPAFILGIIALSISIIGIPALLAWIPFFPVAVIATAVFGYLAVAYATGEFIGESQRLKLEWLKRQDPYVYMLTGVAILLVLHLMANAFQMVGPWFDPIHGLVTVFALLVTWLAFTIGFGAVLVSRFGTRTQAPAATPAVSAETRPTTEEENE